MAAYKLIPEGALFNMRKARSGMHGVTEYFELRNRPDKKEYILTFGVDKEGKIVQCYQYTPMGFSPLVEYQGSEQNIRTYLKKRGTYSLIGDFAYMCITRMVVSDQGVTFPRFELYVPVEVVEQREMGLCVFCYNMENKVKVGCSRDLFEMYKEAVIRQLVSMQMEGRVDFVLKRAS